MNHLLALLLALGGFAGLALAMDRHQDDVFGHELPTATTRALRIAGWTLVIACMAACVAFWGWGLGLVIASGHTSAAAGLIFCALIAHARRREARQPARSARPTPAARSASPPRPAPPVTEHRST